MKKEFYEIVVEETLKRTISVKAYNSCQAVDIVTSMYDNEDIILDSSDFSEVSIFKVNQEEVSK